MISDIFLISELQGEELEYSSIQQIYTGPSLPMSSSEGMFFYVLPVFVVKVLLKQSIEICSNNYLDPINLS